MDARAGMGQTPLEWAAEMNGDPAVVELLLDRGADIEARDFDGGTVLIRAAGRNKSDVVRALLERGADVAAVDRDDMTPLHWAADSNSDPGVVEALLEHGAEVDAISNSMGTPLMTTMYRSNNMAVIRALLEGGADVEATGIRRKSVDMGRIATTTRRSCFCCWSTGGGVTTRDEYDNTVAHTAAERHGPEVMEMLIERGADIDVANQHGRRPIHFAAARDRRLVEMLVEQGADIHAGEDEGNTRAALGVVGRVRERGHGEAAAGAWSRRERAGTGGEDAAPLRRKVQQTWRWPRRCWSMEPT